MNNIPSLGELETSPINEWFEKEENAEAKRQVSLYIKGTGVLKSLRWLEQYFKFPYSESTLRRYARSQGWYPKE